MIVSVIVAILAAVAVPLMTPNKKCAMATEAETGLGLLRMALRTLYAESGAYNRDRSGATISVGSISNIPGVSLIDLSGRWFNVPAYDLQMVAANTFTVRCRGSQSTTSNATDVADLTVTLDEIGNFVRTGY